MGYSQRADLYSAIGSSGVTSTVYNVEGMFGGFTMQVLGAGATSVTTIRGSNDDGRTAAITNWSTLTGFVGNGMINVDSGFRWVQCQRSDTTNVLIAGFQRSR